MSLIIDLKVIPGARHTKIILDKSERLIFYIKSVAQDNKANEELIKTLGLKLGIPKSNILIVNGHKTRYKRICFDQKDLTFAILLGKLGLEKPEYNTKIW